MNGELLKKSILKKTANKYPPIKPDIVFFGLIPVNFGPLKIFPKLYPPMSVAIHIIITNKTCSR